MQKLFLPAVHSVKQKDMTSHRPCRRNFDQSVLRSNDDNSAFQRCGTGSGVPGVLPRCASTREATAAAPALDDAETEA